MSAGVSATLIGLLFVALALNPSIMTDESPAGLRVWSGQTFHSFLMVLTLSMIAVIPGDAGVTIAIALVFIGVTGLIGVVRALATARQDPEPRMALDPFHLALFLANRCLRHLPLGRLFGLAP